ncbi:hypothetical protein D3P07_19510 [Paenibacillus sp. 1011MAR3C5]|uniref:hypothetical protein n=1 Tax=Paenibacillus sp. 1011MAR3C5 TaxID=1675787 RepID=UPI000E6CD306|nr:hypothetical protein [Paenibacillus sp. 1011MAR3C5]RJE86262.1 hypothetical protein D3P07_19510 [Paenibacillus sp. 1011MAR3C5]
MRQHIQIGDYFPDVHLSPDLKLYTLLKDYLLIAMVSTECALCLPAFDEIERFAVDNPDYRLVVLIDTSEEKFELAKQAFSPHIQSYRIEARLDTEINGYGYPWAYGLNSEGQLITHYSCSEPGHLDIIASPFGLFHPIAK